MNSGSCSQISSSCNCPIKSRKNTQPVPKILLPDHFLLRITDESPLFIASLASTTAKGYNQAQKASNISRTRVQLVFFTASDIQS